MKPVAADTPSHSDESVKSATGRTWQEWFKLIDERGGPPLGRRKIGLILYDEFKVDTAWGAAINIEYEAARGIVEKDGRPKGFMICATKTVGVPVSRAYQAFTSARELECWFGAGSAIEFEEGGRFVNSDGDCGTLTRIRTDKAIRFTWEQPRHTPGTVVEVTFQPKGDRCVVMVAHDRIRTRAEADDLRATWSAALDTLKGHLEGAG